MWTGFVLLLALVGIGGTGCAVPNSPLALYRSGPTTHPSFTDVGVLPFEDLRPEEQREGRRPRLVPLIIWNQRIGDYVTGEDAFTGGVSDAVTRGISDALSGGRFGRTRLLELDPDGSQSAASHCGAAGLRWIVSGAIRDLYATARQRFFLTLVPTPWPPSQSEVSVPIGVARIEVRVLDCETREEVLVLDLVASHSYPAATLSQAAVRAFEAVLNDLRSRVAKGTGVDAPAVGERVPALEPL